MILHMDKGGEVVVDEHEEEGGYDKHGKRNWSVGA